MKDFINSIILWKVIAIILASIIIINLSVIHNGFLLIGNTREQVEELSKSNNELVSFMNFVKQLIQQSQTNK